MAVDSNKERVGQSKTLNIPIDKPIADVKRTDLEIDIVAGPALGDLAEKLAFMEEKVEVLVHESTEPNAVTLVDVYHNGTPQRFLRGVPQVVKRKFLYVLASLKQQSISTRVLNNGGANGDPVNQIAKNVALRYPFQVTRDDNPKGPAALKQWLAEA